MSHHLICNDVKRWAAEYDGPPFHALLCDAPYEMGFMDSNGWDATGISFDSSMWAALAAHLHPGAFLFVMAGTINDDLISVALRQAGLRKHHRMLGWVTSQGFPKSTRLDTQIDAAAGAEREIVGRMTNPATPSKGTFNASFDEPVITAPATELARTWSSHRYGGQALKPAIETVLIFQKPYSGKPIDSITATGAGALWIDGGRIGIDSVPSNRWTDNAHPFGNGAGNEYETAYSRGRWPPNFYLTHSPACIDGACVDDCPVKAIGEQSGDYGRASMGGGTTRNEQQSGIEFRKTGNGFQSTQYYDEGNVSRFFLNADWNAETWERLESGDPVLYTAKSSRAERDEGLAEFPELIRNDGRDEALASGDMPQNRSNNPQKNHHATVKPIALTRWLATLLLPPAAYAPRRLLIPFAGVASEMIGAHLAGWEEITGIELEQDHVDIGRARLEWWTRQAAFNFGY